VQPVFGFALIVAGEDPAAQAGDSLRDGHQERL
jgi:hypothetical protein